MKFTPDEIVYLEQSPDAMRIAADYHDLQMCMGEPMGIDTTINMRRYRDLKDEANRVQAAHENGINPETKQPV